MSAIMFGSVLLTISGVIAGVWHAYEIAIMIGVFIAVLGIIFQMFGINKIELEMSDMREEYIDLFNHSDEYSFSYDHPEMFKDVPHKSVEKIDTLNGSEN